MEPLGDQNLLKPILEILSFLLVLGGSTVFAFLISTQSEDYHNYVSPVIILAFKITIWILVFVFSFLLLSAIIALLFPVIDTLFGILP